MLNRWKTQFRASSQILLVSRHELLSHRPRQLDLLRGNPTRGSDEISVIFPSAATTLGQEQRTKSHPKYPHPNSPGYAGWTGGGRSPTHRRRQRLPSSPGGLPLGLRAAPGARAAPMERPARHALSRHPQLPLRCDSDSSPPEIHRHPIYFSYLPNGQSSARSPPAPRQTPTPSPAPGRVSGGLAAYLCRYSWRAEGPHPPPGSASLRRHRAPAGGTGPIPARRPQRGRRLRPAARCPHPLHGLGAAGTLGSVGSPADYIPLRALLLLRAALLQPPPPPQPAPTCCPVLRERGRLLHHPALLARG